MHTAKRLILAVVMSLSAATFAEQSIKAEIANLRQLAKQYQGIGKLPEFHRALDDHRLPIRNEALKLLTENGLVFEGHFENTASLIRGEEYALNMHLLSKISPKPADPEETTRLAIRALCAYAYHRNITRSIRGDFVCSTGLEETLEYMANKKLDSLSRSYSDALEKLATDRDPNIVLAAYSQLGQKFADGRHKQMASFAKHRDPNFRMLACILIDRFDPGSTLPVLTPLLDDTHRNVKSTAAMRLFRNHRQAMKLPMPAEAPTWAKRVLIEYVRVEKEPYQLMKLETLLADADPIVRLELLQAHYAIILRRNIDLARKMLSDPSPMVQKAARTILESRGEKS